MINQNTSKVIFIKSSSNKNKSKDNLPKWEEKVVLSKNVISTKSKPNLLENTTLLDSIPEEMNNSNNRINKTPNGGSDASNEAAQQIPLLSIDVNFGPNMHDKITVFANDDLKKLAYEFKQKHNLSDLLENKLYGMLSEQVKSLL